jgi:hypothetical protein
MERKVGDLLFLWLLILVLLLHPVWLVLGNMEGWLFLCSFIGFFGTVFLLVFFLFENLKLILVFALFVHL